MRKSRRNQNGQGIIWAPLVLIIATICYCWKQLLALFIVARIIVLTKDRLVNIVGNKLWKLGLIVIVPVFLLALFWNQLSEFFDMNEEFSQVIKIVDEIDS